MGLYIWIGWHGIWKWKQVQCWRGTTASPNRHFPYSWWKWSSVMDGPLELAVLAAAGRSEIRQISTWNEVKMQIRKGSCFIRGLKLNFYISSSENKIVHFSETKAFDLPPLHSWGGERQERQPEGSAKHKSEHSEDLNSLYRQSTAIKHLLKSLQRQKTSFLRVWYRSDKAVFSRHLIR